MISSRVPCRSWRVTLAGLALGLLCGLVVVPPALGAEPAPKWKLESRAAPTNLPLEGRGLVLVTASDLGGIADGETAEITITDTLPAGVELNREVAQPITAKGEGTPRSREDHGSCPTPAPGEPIVCKFDKTVFPYEELVLYLDVKTHFASSSEPVNKVTASGGGAPEEETLGQALKINGQETGFGVEQFELLPEKIEEREGSEVLAPDTQAGSHPFQLTTTFNLNQIEVGLSPHAPALQRTLRFNLPPGLIGDANVVGNAAAAQQCQGVDFGAVYVGGLNGCPPDTAIGVAAFTFFEPNSLGFHTEVVPIFNLVPTPGEPARFGFEADHVPVVLDTSVRTGSDYGVTVTVHNASQVVQVLGSRVTIWGVPEASSHDQARGWSCLGFDTGKPCASPEVSEPTAFLTLPTSCSGTPTTSVSGESWPHEEGREVVVNRIGDGPGEASENTTYKLPEFTGCSLVGFEPTLRVEPETHEPNAPTGLTMHIHVPQRSSLEAEGIAQSAIKSTTVEFPVGVVLNSAAADGLEACLEGATEVQPGVGRGGVGFTGNKELGEGFEGAVPTFTETLPEPLEPGSNFCANASKIGVVHIKTPDLPNELEGGVYTAAQTANPFGSLFAIYLVAQDPVSKVLVKVAGEVQLNPATGQIKTTFANTPDVSFEELTLELFKGQRATLSTPPCGEGGPTKATFVSWSGKTKTEEASGLESDCTGAEPLNPALKAGSANPQAGAFSPFELTLTRPQGNQALTGLSVTLPPGLAAMISSVEQCGEPQASEGTCGPGSEIGEAIASVGVGDEPYTVKGGKVFLTGPYDGAPFGLSIKLPAEAGPFHFGYAVTRSTIEVNPETAAVTINSPLPTMLNPPTLHLQSSLEPKYSEGTGVAVELEQVHVIVNRQDFQFNPTNCSELHIEGTVTGSKGTKSSVSYPYNATGCSSLPFHPKLTASVGSTASKVGGVGFKVLVQSAGLGQEDIHKVELELPEALPSRNSTLQQACLEKVFNENPAGCDEASNIGYAIVHTPVLKSPLEGPAYLVSHGGAAFPDVEFVLQGEGIKLVLDGKTDIKKINGAEVTFSRFESAPDAPFTSFETVLPEGPHSILTSYVPKDEYNLCAATNLNMPTTIVAQNGDTLEQDTEIVPVGCSGVKGQKVESRTAKLDKALKACKSKKKKAKRTACERSARKKYSGHAAGRRAHASAKKHARKKR